MADVCTQLPLKLPRQRVDIDTGAVCRMPSMTKAIVLCAELAGLENDKDQARAIDLDATTWSLVKDGKRAFPHDRYEQMFDEFGNEAPLIWLADRRGYLLTPKESELERRPRQARAARKRDEPDGLSAGEQSLPSGRDVEMKQHHAPQACGYVYFIHTPTFSHYYIGSTDKPSIRFKHHRANLRAGKHHNARLQRTFNKFGPGALLFSVAEATETREAAAQLEHELLAFHFRKPGCLNVSSSGLLAVPCPHVTQRRNEILRGIAHRTQASVLAKAWQEQNPAKAQDRTNRLVQWGRSPGGRAARAAASKARGDTPESKAAFVARLARARAQGMTPNAKPVIRIADDGTETRYPSAMTAMRETGIHFNCISRVILGKGKRAGGYRWRAA